MREGSDPEAGPLTWTATVHGGVCLATLPERSGAGGWGRQLAPAGRTHALRRSQQTRSGGEGPLASSHAAGAAVKSSACGRPGVVQPRHHSGAPRRPTEQPKNSNNVQRPCPLHDTSSKESRVWKGPSPQAFPTQRGRHDRLPARIAPSQRHHHHHPTRSTAADHHLPSCPKFLNRDLVMMHLPASMRAVPSFRVPRAALVP